MYGVAAVRAALIADSGVTALVPAARILAGDLPQGTTLPAISLGMISKVDRNIPNPGVKRFVNERVQVMIHAATYPSQKTIEVAVRGAAADVIGISVTGLDNVTIHTDAAGPDFMNEEATIFLGLQDFIVTYSEVR